MNLTPPTLTPELRAALLAELQTGASLRVAARACGVRQGVVRRWMRHDRQLHDELERAMAQAEQQHRRTLATDGDWKAAAWLLDHTPTPYKPRARASTVEAERAAILEAAYRTFERGLQSRDERIQMAAAMALVQHVDEFAGRAAVVVEAVPRDPRLMSDEELEAAARKLIPSPLRALPGGKRRRSG